MVRKQLLPEATFVDGTEDSEPGETFVDASTLPPETTLDVRPSRPAELLNDRAYRRALMALGAGAAVVLMLLGFWLVNLADLEVVTPPPATKIGGVVARPVA